MARISAEERVWSGQYAVWSVLPRLASRLAALAALFLILAGGWLIKGPLGNSANASTTDGLFDTSQAQLSHDDVLGGVLEKAR